MAQALLEEIPLLSAKISAACSVEGEAVLALLTEVLRFMHLIADSDQPMSPSQRVDLGWHEFILFTRRYAQFCDEHFQRMIHHSPGGSAASNQRQFERTLESYRKRFGVPAPAFWGPSTPDCGACESD
ncbi:MAG: hypothetical protein AB8B91_03955 [Rubripirellula sp.]